MSTETKLPTYPVEFIEAEVIVLETPRVRPAIQRSRFTQFIDNVALAIITGSISEEAVFQRTTPPVFEAIQAAMTRFDELNKLYSSHSTLEGVNEFLEPEKFTFRNTPHGYTSN